MGTVTSLRVHNTPSSSGNPTHRLLSSSFLGLRYRILNLNHKKELLRGLCKPYNVTKGFSVVKVCFEALGNGAASKECTPPESLEGPGIGQERV